MQAIFVFCLSNFCPDCVQTKNDVAAIKQTGAAARAPTRQLRFMLSQRFDLDAIALPIFWLPSMPSWGA